MPEEAEDNKEQFAAEWDKNVDTLSRIPQWNVNMLGTSMEDYRLSLGKSAQKKFIEKDLNVFLSKGIKEGKNPQELRGEAANKTQTDAGLAVLFDKTRFFKEVEAGLKNRDASTWTKIKDWIFKEGLPASVKKWGNADKFQERFKALLSTRGEIEDLNGVIFMHRRVLSLREKQLLENAEQNRNPETDSAIREDILERQQDIKARVNERTKVLDQKDGVIDNLEGFNELWAAVDRELKVENRKIEKEFGGRVTGLFSQRQALILELNQLGSQQVEHMQRQFQIKEEIHKIEVQLEKIQKELILYKARNPLFLFETYLRHQSVDSIKGFGPPSDNFVANAWEKSRGDKNTEGGGLQPPMTTEETKTDLRVFSDKELHDPEDEEAEDGDSSKYGDEPAHDPNQDKKLN